MRFSRNPIVILVSIVSAVTLGTLVRPFSLALAPAGDLYIGLLKMCVVPMLFSIVALSLMRLMISQNARRHTVALLWVVPLALVITAAVATLAGAASHGGGNGNTTSLSALGVAVRAAERPIEVPLYGPRPDPGPSTAEKLVANLVPDNIFAAFASGDAIKILLFAILFGVALGALYGSQFHVVYEFLEEIYHAFYQILDWLLIALPLGLFCIMASATARVDLRVFEAMAAFAGSFIALSVALYVLYVAAVASLGRVTFFKAARELRAAALLAFSTRNSFASMPLAISALELLNFDEEGVQLLVPLATSFCRLGSVAYFSLAAFFVAHLYGSGAGLLNALVIAGAAVAAGVSSAGTTGIVSLLPLGLVLQSIGLPFDAVLILFIAIDPLMDPFRTALTVIGGAAVAAAVARPSDETAAERSPRVTFA